MAEKMAPQQAAYKVAGVDENEPAMDVRKRKAADVEEVRVKPIPPWGSLIDRMQEANTAKAKKQKAGDPRPERKNNAIYVTSLPDDVTAEELHDVFCRYGVIAESADSNKPRIKLYADDQGNFKGDALIGELPSACV